MCISKSYLLTVCVLNFLFIFLNDAYSQSLPDSTIKKIDSLFIKWNNETSPGCAIGIVRNDSLIYAKGYGMSNLEYGIQNNPETIFHMASISKQFTAYSIVLLVRQGKLNLDDDIHKYLSWFPDLKEKITIRNLLNHTSGIRDQWQLLVISGTRLDDVIKQEHIIKILSKQRALNFKPGEQYSYSNRTDSNHFANSILSYSNAGATSLFTNINDMSKWIMNFYDHKVGDQKDIDQLTQKGKLNNGKELTYALGIVSDTYKGWRQFSHGGGDAGYRTYLTVFPDLKMGFIVFSNVGDFDAGGKAYEIADIFVKDTAKKNDAAMKEKKDSSAAILKDSLSMKKFLGNYISEDGLLVSFEIRQGKLYNHVFNQTLLLVKGQKDTFSIFNMPDVKIFFSIKAKDTNAVAITPDQTYYLKKYIKDTSKSDQLLKTYAGTYYCPELDCKYGIALKDHHLMLTNNKYDDAVLTLIGTDHLTSDYWWMNHLMIMRNNKNQIIGFEVNSGRIMHLKFNKIE